jgi:hypothetical protein
MDYNQKLNSYPNIILAIDQELDIHFYQVRIKVFSRFKTSYILHSITVFPVSDLNIEALVLVKYCKDIILPELTNENAFLV